MLLLALFWQATGFQTCRQAASCAACTVCIALHCPTSCPLWLTLVRTKWFGPVLLVFTTNHHSVTSKMRSGPQFQPLQLVMRLTTFLDARTDSAVEYSLY